MMSKSIVCRACGIQAVRSQIDGKPWLEINSVDFSDLCAEPIVARAPFRCPHILLAAVSVGLVGTDGSMIDQSWSEHAHTDRTGAGHSDTARSALNAADARRLGTRVCRVDPSGPRVRKPRAA